MIDRLVVDKVDRGSDASDIRQPVIMQVLQICMRIDGEIVRIFSLPDPGQSFLDQINDVFKPYGLILVSENV